jgi:hypothetical protein
MQLEAPTRCHAVAAAAIAAAIAGCAGPGAALPPMQVNGRYLQAKHPVSGVPALQIALPNQEGCASMLAVMRQQDPNNYLISLWSCSANSASASLPTRATVRNKTYAFLLDVEAISMQECKESVDGMMNSKGKDNLEVVSACATK